MGYFSFYILQKRAILRVNFTMILGKFFWMERSGAGGLRRRTSNPEALGSSPAPTTWIRFTVAPFSNPRPQWLASHQLRFLTNVMFSLYVYFTGL